MMDMGYPLQLIDLLAKLYSKQLARVKVVRTLSEWFPVKKGVRQGCVLSLYLLNILAEMAIGENFKIYLLRQFCWNRVEFFYNTQESQTQKPAVGCHYQNFEIRIL